jgi:hypothetical protein
VKQHTTPILLKNNIVETLEKVHLNTSLYDENWIQNICFQNPQILPFDELEPTFIGMIPICRELSTDSGFIDLIYINEYGFITIGECKLWRNPEARRKVIGQILDYAKDLSKWDFKKFETECLKARNDNKSSLLEILIEYFPEIDESNFIDNIQKNLQKGRFLLTIIGDGIRENVEELTSYIQRNTNLNFTLGLIEIPVFKNTKTEELIITPRIIAKTKEIERIVYRISENFAETVINEKQENQNSISISEKVFYERLEKYIGKEKQQILCEFIQQLTDELNFVSKLGRGKRLSLNIKSPNENYNFASIQESGEVWFYGITYIGNKQIGVDYLKKLATLLNANFDDSYKEWQWCIKRNGKYLSVIEYLNKKDDWKKIIIDTLDKIKMIEEQQ